MARSFSEMKLGRSEVVKRTAEADFRDPVKDLIIAEHGVIVIQMTAEKLLPEVRAAVEQSATQGSDKFLCLPDVTSITSIHSGGERRVSLAEILNAANKTQTGGIDPKIIVYGKGTVDWFCTAGISILKQHLDGRADLVIIEQVLKGPATPAVTDALLQLSYIARATNVRLVVVLSCPESLEKSGLSERVDEYILVKECAPYPGYVTAFSIDNINLRLLNSLGFGKKICYSKIVEGKFQRRYEQYISDDLETRLIWLSVKNGKSDKEIADEFGKNRSSIFRMRHNFPVQSKPRVSVNTLNRYLKARKDAFADAAQETEEDISDSDVNSYIK